MRKYLGVLTFAGGLAAAFGAASGRAQSTTETARDHLVAAKKAAGVRGLRSLRSPLLAFAHRRLFAVRQDLSSR